MPKAMLLLDTLNDKHYIGYTLTQLLGETGMVTYAVDKRQVWVGKHLAQTFTEDWTDLEMASEMRPSALRFFRNQLNWKFFAEVNL